MQIKLAGYNVESEILEKLDSSDRHPLTPETFSSAYARISRSSKDVTALRQQAREDVNKARKSNQKIIFQMGHHSVAEHAVFNFDIIAVSRLALEEIEKFRLVSYTEKSQRYVTLDGDYVLPKEIDDKESIDLFRNTVQTQNLFYLKAYEILKEYLFKKYPEKISKRSNRKVIEGWAKEDARYILSLATEGQVGMTINARNLEHLFRRFALCKRMEVQKIGSAMYNLVEKIAPSLILFPDPSSFEQNFVDDDYKKWLNEATSGLGTSHVNDFETGEDGLYRLKILDYSEDADEMILSAILAFLKEMDFQCVFRAVKVMKESERKKLFLSLFEKMEFFDSPPREFELPDLKFQTIVSASNFAQLKRHRMATLLSGDYNISFGNVIPDNIKINGLENEFIEIIEKTNEAYMRLKDKHGCAADYVLTNSHCRSVVMKMNMREAYHFARLRADQHAQWDIRNLAILLVQKIRELMPLSAMVLGGKSDYVRLYRDIYKKEPTFLI